MFVEPGEDVYEGMIVGENARQEDPRRQRRPRRSTSPTCAPRRPTCWCGWCPRASSRSTRRWSSCVRTNASRSHHIRANAQGRARSSGTRKSSATSRSVISTPTLGATGTDAHRPPEVRGLARGCTRRHGGGRTPRASPCSRTSARRRCWGATGRRAARRAAAALDVSRSAMGEYELVVLRDADPRALRAVLDNTPAAIFLKTPTGATCWSTARSSGCTAVRRASSSASSTRTSCARRRRAHARRRPARDVRSHADRAPGGGPPRRADAHLPVAEVPARRRGRRALRRRRRGHRHHPPHAPGGAPARGAAPGGGRPARGRRRARLQQPAGGDRQLRGVRAQGAADDMRARRRGPDHRRRGAAIASSRGGCCCSRAASPARPRCSRRGASSRASSCCCSARSARRSTSRSSTSGCGTSSRPQPARAGPDEPGAELARGDARRRPLRIKAENAAMRDADSPSSRAVRLTVADTGRGMAREVPRTRSSPSSPPRPSPATASGSGWRRSTGS